MSIQRGILMSIFTDQYKLAVALIQSKQQEKGNQHHHFNSRAGSNTPCMVCSKNLYF
jgi:hypothetical protein